MQNRNKRWHCEKWKPGGRSLRAEATDGLIWGSARESMTNRSSSSNGVKRSVCVTVRGAASRNLRPSEWGRRRASEEPPPRKRVTARPGFSGWYILIIPHMHTFTVQDAQFVISFSKVQRSNMPRPQRRKGEGSAAKLHRTKSAPTVSGVTL